MTRKKKISKESVFDVYTDGGCLFNPGGPGACAAVMVDNELSSNINGKGNAPFKNAQ